MMRLIGFLLFGILFWPLLALANYKSGFAAYAQGDYTTACKEWRPLAEQGDSQAQYEMGGMYDTGMCVPENNAQAAKWYLMAAEHGHTGAQALLGAMYEQGKGVPEDDVQAYAWLNIAAAQGHQLDERGEKRIAKSMTKKERTRAQELSREYLGSLRAAFRN